MISKRRKVWIGLGVLGLLLVAIPMLWPVDEPKYKGRYLSEWHKIYEETHSDPDRLGEFLDAQDAVRSIGTNALPYYLDWIDYELPPWRLTFYRNLANRINRNSTTYNVLFGEFNRSRYAGLGIGILGTNALSAVPALESLMKDSSKPSSSARAMSALASVGEPSIPILKSVLADTKLINRMVIPQALGIAAYHVGTNAVLPILIEATQDRDFFVRLSATNVLREIAPEVLTNAPSN